MIRNPCNKCKRQKVADDEEVTESFLVETFRSDKRFRYQGPDLLPILTMSSIFDNILYLELEMKTDASWNPKCYGIFDLDGIVEIICLAEHYNLMKTLGHGIRWVNQVFCQQYCHLQPTIFSVWHIRKLQPLFQRRLVDGWDCTLDEFTDEELTSSAFPQCLHARIQERHETTQKVFRSIHATSFLSPVYRTRWCPLQVCKKGGVPS